MKKIVMTGGGTAGHVTPNIALVPELKKAGYEINYIGTEKGMERDLVEREGIPYHYISAGKLRRYWDKKNITDTFRIARGFFQAQSVLSRIKPDVVFSKGGFVSCPVVWAAWMQRIPVIIHESDMTPGLANRLSMPFAKKICYTFPETEKHIPKDKGVLTGIPVRRKLLSGNRDTGLKLCGFEDSKPVIVIIGGSQGSGILNKAIRESLNELTLKYQICHICGKGNIDETLKGKGGYVQFEYINEELSHIFAMADIIISRAGATTIFEILALKKPNLLIPLSKKASRGDQILNAKSFKKQGFSLVLEEEELNKQSLISSIDELYKNRNKYIDRMASSKMADSIDKIIGIIDKQRKK